jgi:ACS family glucarate transporter-like MFS transporter
MTPTVASENSLAFVNGMRTFRVREDDECANRQEPMTDSIDARPAFSTEAPPLRLDNMGDARPTHIRHSVVAVTAFAAFLMYLDRICISQMVSNKSLQHDLGLTDANVARILGVFFFAYALGQIPGGWLADRFRMRPLMTLLIGIWSAFTLMTGFAVGFWSLIFARVGCGLAEAGAYPASSKLVPRWVPFFSWGRANAIISAGGRFGGAVAPVLTALAMVYIGTWRTPGRIFGMVGVVFAVVFWFVFRDRPADHPLCNAAERSLIEGDKPPEDSAATHVRPRTPWRALLTSRDMWLMCLYQFLTNVGWVFLVTFMPKFLREARGQGDLDTGSLASLVLVGGIVGMLAGGWLTDTLTRRLGVRRGRMIPMVWSRVAGAAAYLLCLRFGSATACVAAFAVVAAMTDISIPPTWGYFQDVAGRNVAAMFAWANMWGNLGAGATPEMLNWINAHFDPDHNWHASLAFLAIAFLLSGVAAMGIRADVKIAETGTGR